MALVPVTLRPSFVIRRNAMRKGVLGPSTVWKVVAFVVFGRNIAKRLFGRHPESLGTRTIGVGQVLTVAAAAPLARRQAKRAGITKASLERAAWADLEGVQQSS